MPKALVPTPNTGGQHWERFHVLVLLYRPVFGDVSLLQATITLVDKINLHVYYMSLTCLLHDFQIEITFGLQDLYKMNSAL